MLKQRSASVSEPKNAFIAATRSSEGRPTPDLQETDSLSFSFPLNRRSRYHHIVLPGSLLISLLVIIGLLSLIGGILLAGRVINPPVSPPLSSSQTAATSPPLTLRQLNNPAHTLQAALASPLLYHDALNDPNTIDTQKKHWTSITNVCAFASDGYHVRGNPRSFCHEMGASYQNMTISVDMSITEGYSGGLLLRDQSIYNQDGAYFFEISTDGRYHIINSGMYGTMHNWTSTSALHWGRSISNTLQIIASGSLFLFYLNNVYITSIRDTWYKSGGISFACFAQSGPCESTFRNLNVYLYP